MPETFRLYLDQMLRVDVAEALRGEGHDVVRVSEVGESRAAETIRSLWPEEVRRFFLPAWKILRNCSVWEEKWLIGFWWNEYWKTLDPMKAGTYIHGVKVLGGTEGNRRCQVLKFDISPAIKGCPKESETNS